MSNRRRYTIMDQLGEFTRSVAGWFLAILMLLPALIIYFADKITMWRIRRRGGIG